MTGRLMGVGVAVVVDLVDDSLSATAKLVEDSALFSVL